MQWPATYAPEVRIRPARLRLKNENEHDSRWAAIRSAPSKRCSSLEIQLQHRLCHTAPTPGDDATAPPNTGTHCGNPGVRIAPSDSAGVFPAASFRTGEARPPTDVVRKCIVSHGRTRPSRPPGSHGCPVDAIRKQLSPSALRTQHRRVRQLCRCDRRQTPRWLPLFRRERPTPPHPMSSLVAHDRRYCFRPDTPVLAHRSQHVKPPQDPTQLPTPTHYWIEKSLVAGRPDRDDAEWGMGKSIWSPLTAQDGRNYYRLMHKVSPGDVILHFINNRHFAGISRVKSGADTTSMPPSGTPWSNRPCIRYPLTDYAPLTPPIHRRALFVDPAGQTRSREILTNHSNLFFNRNLKLNQGAYLTEAPRVLLKFLNDLYRQSSGNGLPHVVFEGAEPTIETDPNPSVSSPPIPDWLEAETLWTKEHLSEVLETLSSSSPHLVLAGPPGTGKTWVAQLLARHVTADLVSHQRLVQFHPSYSYETFIQGLQPVAAHGAITFRVVPGVVLEIAEQLRDDPRPFVLVLDEMNRANLPRVLGELMYLLEYRNRRIDLPYKKGFRLPPNLQVIGTMNTADRSIRSIDTALRLRLAGPGGKSACWGKGFGAPCR